MVAMGNKLYKDVATFFVSPLFGGGGNGFRHVNDVIDMQVPKPCPFSDTCSTVGSS